jgi:hypothetical protein
MKFTPVFTKAEVDYLMLHFFFFATYQKHHQPDHDNG